MRCASAEGNTQAADLVVALRVIRFRTRSADPRSDDLPQRIRYARREPSRLPPTCSADSTSRRANWPRRERGSQSWNDFWPRRVASLQSKRQTESTPIARSLEVEVKAVVRVERDGAVWVNEFALNVPSGGAEPAALTVTERVPPVKVFLPAEAREHMPGIGFRAEKVKDIGAQHIDIGELVAADVGTDLRAGGL